MPVGNEAILNSIMDDRSHVRRTLPNRASDLSQLFADNGPHHTSKGGSRHRPQSRDIIDWSSSITKITVPESPQREYITRKRDDQMYKSEHMASRRSRRGSRTSRQHQGLRREGVIRQTEGQGGPPEGELESSCCHPHSASSRLSLSPASTDAAPQLDALRYGLVVR